MEAVGVVIYPTFCQFAVQVFSHSCRVLITVCARLPKPTQVVLFNLVLRHAVCRSVFYGINRLLTLLERHSGRQRLRHPTLQELIYSCVGLARTSFCRALRLQVSYGQLSHYLVDGSTHVRKHKAVAWRSKLSSGLIWSVTNLELPIASRFANRPSASSSVGARTSSHKV